MNKEEKKDTVSLYESLDRAMWIIKHSRYNASDRLKKKHYISIYSISILSVYVLILSLLNKYGFMVDNSQIYDLLSVASAIFILVLSLAEASKNYIVASERLFISGNEIRDFLDELKKYDRHSGADISSIEKISTKYSNALKVCSENHETVDYDLLRAQRISYFEEMNWLYGLWFKAKFFMNIYWFHCSLIIIPPLIFWKFS